MRYFSILLMVLSSSLLLFNCQQTEDEGKLVLDNVVEEQAAFGYLINDIANTGNEIEQLTSDPFAVEDEDLPDLGSAQMLKERAVELSLKVSPAISGLPVLAKTNGDTALWSEEVYFLGYGRRTTIYYDFDTGKARLVEVYFQFPELRNMVYDSTQIIIDLNFTLETADDDKIESLLRKQLFKDTFFIESILSEVEVTAYEGNEPIGVTAITDTYYQAGRELIRKKSTATFLNDETGTVREDFYFNDDTDSYNEFTFNSDHTGTFEKKRRDGTLVLGTFDQVEDDNQGGYTSTIDFPDGHYLDKIMKAATVWIEEAIVGTVFHANFSEAIYFSNGNVDSSSVGIEAWETEDVRYTNLTVTKRNGAHGTMSITEDETGSRLSGQWTTWNGYYIRVDAQYFMDGSGNLHYEVYASYDSWEQGEDPVLVADYNFIGEQGGNGTLTYGDKTYQLTFDSAGHAVISDGVNNKMLNLYAQ